MKNILVIKLRYIGDVLLATPVLHALREGFPTARLTMLVNRGTHEVLSRNPDVDEVLVVERGTLAAQLGFARALRRRGFDCVIDLTDGDRSAILTRLTGAPVRIGFNAERRWRGLLYSTVVSAPCGRMHMVDDHLEVMRTLGVHPTVRTEILQTSAEDDRGADRLLAKLGVRPGERPVMIHPGARYQYRRWPTERFAALADRLAEAGRRVLLAGDARDQTAAAEILAATKSSPVSLVGKTAILELAAVMKRCSLAIGLESGPSHMAAALGMPTLALYGKGNPAVWGPRGRQVVVLHKGVNCEGCPHPICRRGEDSCMNQISVDEVFAAVWRLLENT